MTATPPPLAPDLEAGLRRLRLSAIRKLSPELLVTAKTQRWKPEEFLRTLIEAEIASRDLSNARARMKVAAFPVTKTLEEFDVAASSVKQQTFDYLAEPRVGPGQGEPLSGRTGGNGQEPPARRPRTSGRRSRISGPLLHRHRAGRDPLSGHRRQLGGQGDHPDPQSRPDPHRRDRVRSDGRHRSRAVLPSGGCRL